MLLEVLQRDCDWGTGRMCLKRTRSIRPEVIVHKYLNDIRNKTCWVIQLEYRKQKSHEYPSDPTSFSRTAYGRDVEPFPRLFLIRSKSSHNNIKLRSAPAHAHGSQGRSVRIIQVFTLPGIGVPDESWGGSASNTLHTQPGSTMRATRTTRRSFAPPNRRSTSSGLPSNAWP